MNELTSLDYKILNHKIENIFPIVADFESYKHWFPQKPEITLIKSAKDKIGSIIQIKTGIVKFNIELMRINTNKEIIVQYYGAYEGKGIWYFFESANGTKLMYEIELKVKNPLVRFVSLFVNLAAIHSKMMTKVFNGLEDYLNKLYKTEKNGHDNLSNAQPKIFSITSN